MGRLLTSVLAKPRLENISTNNDTVPSCGATGRFEYALKLKQIEMIVKKTLAT